MVAASHRRRGVGRGLLEAGRHLGRGGGRAEAGAPRVPLERARDRALRSVVGFEREGLRKGHYLRDGVAVDAILMALTLDDVSSP